MSLVRREDSEPRHLILVDATRGGFYDPAGVSGACVVGVNAGDPADPDLEHSSEIVGAFLDPRALVLHDLGRDVPGTDFPDRRMSWRVVNDYFGPQASAEPGAAPFGQDEWHTALNRSTREADLSGRTALPGSMRRIVDSEDDRYALALSINWVPMQRLAGEEDRPGEGTRTRATRRRSPEELFLGQGPAAAEPLDLLPDQAGASAEARLWLRRNRPQGLIADELGNVGSLASVLTAGRDPGKRLFRGREGTVSRFFGIRNDAHFVSATGRDGPLCIDYRDARMVSDNGGPVVLPGTGDLDPDPPGAKPIKGRHHWDSSKAGRRVDESGGGPLSPLSFPAGEIVPVIYVHVDDIGPPEVDQQGRPKPPPPPPNPPPPFPPPPPPGGGGGGPPSPPEGPAAYIGAPWHEIIPVPPPPRDPQLVFPDPFDVTGGGGELGDGTGIVGSGGTATGGAGGGGGGVGVVGSAGASQERELGGEGVPCPLSSAAVSFGNPLDLVDEAVREGLNKLGGANTIQGTGGTTVVPGHVPITSDGSTAQLGGPSGAQVNLLPGGPALATNAAQLRVPLFGQPGSGATLADQLLLLQVGQQALQAVVLGAFGGPGYLASNIGLIHRNTPGNPPARNVIGHNYTATPGQVLAVGTPALEVRSVINAPAGSSAEATGPGCASFIREVHGEVNDQRPLIELNNGGSQAPQVAGEGFQVSGTGGVSCSEVRAQLLATKDRAWGVQGGVQTIGELEEHPDAPVEGQTQLYSLGGSTYMQASDGTKTVLGAGGANGVDSIAGLTGAITASDARTALSLVPGTDILATSAVGTAVQAYSAALDTFAAATGMDGQVLTWDSGGFGWQDAAGGGATPGLGTVLAEDNTTGGTDLIVSSGDGLFFDGVSATSGSWLDSSGQFQTGTLTQMLDALTGASGEGALVRQSGSWTALGTAASSYLGAGSGGTIGYQTRLALSHDAGAASNANFGSIALTNSGSGRSLLTMNRTRASGSDSTGGQDRYGCSWARGGSTIGYMLGAVAEGTNSYDLGVFADASENHKFTAFDKSKNGPYVNTNGGYHGKLAGVGGLTNPSTGDFAFGANSSGVPVMLTNPSGSVLSYSLMSPQAEPTPPSGFGSFSDVETWAVAIQAAIKSSGVFF